MRLAVVCAIAAILCGCGENSGSNSGGTNSPSTNASAPAAAGGYLGAVADGKKRAEATIDTTSIDKAIELFNVDKGRNPTSLDELVKDKYLPTMPTAPYGSRLQYDANSGKVSVVKE